MASEPTLPTGWIDASRRYASDYFLEAVKRAARVPVSQATLANWEILAEADKKARDYLAPLCLEVGEDYMTAVLDATIMTATEYRPPARALKLREVQFLTSAGDPIDVPRLSLDALEGADWGFYFKGNTVVLKDATEVGGATLRWWYYLRPSRLVLAAEAGVVSSVNTTTGAITLHTAMSGFTGKTSFDIVRGSPPFEVAKADVAGTYSAGVVTIAAADLPAGLASGDFVALPQETPVPQFSPELWNLLVQATAVEILDGAGDAAAFERAVSKLAKLDGDARVVLAGRVEGEPEALGTKHDPIWDRSWSRGVGWRW